MEWIFGTAQLRDGYGIVNPKGLGSSPDELLRCAAEAGFDAVDTAPVYGAAETWVGTSGHMFRVHTKLDPSVSPDQSLAGSLRRLKRDVVDVLYLHDSQEILNPSSAVLEQAGGHVGHTVGALGVSIYDAAEFDAALASGRITVIQVPINPAGCPVSSSQLERAHAQGVGIVARSVFLQGALVTPVARLPDSVRHLSSFVESFHKVCDRWNRTPVEVCLGWVRSQADVSGVILGAVSCEQVSQLRQSIEAPPLPYELLDELERLDRPRTTGVDPRTWQ